MQLNVLLFSIFTELCKHHYYLIQEFSSAHKETSDPLAGTPHFLLISYLHPLETINLFPVSMDWLILEISYTWNQCSLLQLASFT